MAVSHEDFRVGAILSRDTQAGQCRAFPEVIGANELRESDGDCDDALPAHLIADARDSMVPVAGVAASCVGIAIALLAFLFGGDLLLGRLLVAWGWV